MASPNSRPKAASSADGQVARPVNRELHADQTGEGGDEREDADGADEVAAQVGAEREEAGGRRDISHRLREQGVGAVAGGHVDRLECD